MFRQKSWIDEANETVKIYDVLTSLGIYVPDTILNGSTKKVHCPFGFYHSDSGLSKAMRVYPQTNSAYCFSCSKSYSPVTLFATSKDCSYISAALQLLEEVGYKPKTIEQRWEELNTVIIEKPDTLALADALKTYCSSICPDWVIRQLDKEVADKLSQCLKLLDKVHTDESAHRWLSTTKQIMKRKLEDVLSK